jgi:hypothetical protein
MPAQQPDMNPNYLQMLEQLRELIVRGERERLDEIQRILDTPEELDKKAAPVIEQHLDERVSHIQNNFKQTFGKQVNKLVEQKLEASKEELLNLLYPMIGSMVKKFISYQFQLLQESIEEQIQSTRSFFSPKNMVRRVKVMLFGISEEDQLLLDLGKITVEEVYVIQKDSGLLIGSYSKNETMNQDMVAGMITALKAFAEDAFQRQHEELEMIEWGGYNIVIQNVYSYYFAAAVSGLMTVRTKRKISEQLLDFAQKEIGDLRLSKIDSNLYEEVSSKLGTFILSNPNNEQ